MPACESRPRSLAAGGRSAAPSKQGVQGTGDAVVRCLRGARPARRLLVGCRLAASGLRAKSDLEVGDAATETLADEVFHLMPLRVETSIQRATSAFRDELGSLPSRDSVVLAMSPLQHGGGWSAHTYRAAHFDLPHRQARTRRCPHAGTANDRELRPVWVSSRPARPRSQDLEPGFQPTPGRRPRLSKVVHPDALVDFSADPVQRRSGSAHFDAIESMSTARADRAD